MKEKEEREVEKLNSGRMMREATRELLPLLEKMRAGAIQRIIFAHKDHKPHEFPAAAAELSVIEDLRNNIEKTNKETIKLEERLYGNSERE